MSPELISPLPTHPSKRCLKMNTKYTSLSSALPTKGLLAMALAGLLAACASTQSTGKAGQPQT
jgi:hypothetical protein